MGTWVVEQLADPAAAHPGDVAPAQLGRDALAFQYVCSRTGMTTCSTQAGCVSPQGRAARVAAVRARHAAAPVRALPAPQRGATKRSYRQHRADAVLASDAHRAGARTDHRGFAAASLLIGWTPAPPRQEAKAGPSWNACRSQRRLGSRALSRSAAQISSMPRTLAGLFQEPLGTSLRRGSRPASRGRADPETSIRHPMEGPRRRRVRKPHAVWLVVSGRNFTPSPTVENAPPHSSDRPERRLAARSFPRGAGSRRLQREDLRVVDQAMNHRRGHDIVAQAETLCCVTMSEARS